MLSWVPEEKDWLLQVDAHLATTDSLVVQETIALLHFSHFELRQVLEDYPHGSEALNDAEADVRVAESELAARRCIGFPWILLLLLLKVLLYPYLFFDLLMHFIYHFCHRSGACHGYINHVVIFFELYHRKSDLFFIIKKWIWPYSYINFDQWLRAS